MAAEGTVSAPIPIPECRGDVQTRPRASHTASSFASTGSSGGLVNRGGSPPHDTPAPPVVWESDEVSACTACTTAFTMITRRHHCRACGKVYCNACCGVYVWLHGFPAKQRVCKACAATHVNNSQQESWVANSMAAHCTGCSGKFGLLRRRHHCRACGKIYCDTCCSNTLKLPGFPTPQRACDACVAAGEASPPVSCNSACSSLPSPPLLPIHIPDASPLPSPTSVELSGKPIEEDFVLVTPDSPASPKPSGSYPTARNSVLALVSRITAAASRVALQFPSYDFSFWLNPSPTTPFTVEISTRHWDDTFGLLYGAGRWGHDLSQEVKSTAGSLQAIRKLVAEGALQERTAQNHWLNMPVAVENHPEDETWHPDNLSTQIGGVYHECKGLIPAETWTGGKGDKAQVGKLTGTMVLHGSNAVAKQLMVTAGVSQIFATEEEKVSRTTSSYVIGRHGRVDTEAKAQQLANLVALALEWLCGSAPSFRDRHRPGGHRPVRVRFCSLLNALTVDQKELAFFRRQLAVLTDGFISPSFPEPRPRRRQPHLNSPPPSPSQHISYTSNREDSPSSSPAVQALHAVPGLDDSMASLPCEEDKGNSFEFYSAMCALNVEYACLNYVANWPLCLRLGTAAPHGKHNVQHVMGFRCHLRWLAQDVVDAFHRYSTDEPPAEVVSLSHGIGGDLTGEGWKDVTTRLKSAVDSLAPGPSPEDAVVISELSMACVLLRELVQGKGMNFRHRAAELLQLTLLECILRVVPFYNCKSGVDRTGVCVALATTFYQLKESSHPYLWRWYFLSLLYPVVLKTQYNIHGCGDVDGSGRRKVPLKQLQACIQGSTVLPPFPADPDEAEEYSQIEELCQLIDPVNIGAEHPAMGTVEHRAHEVLTALFLRPGGIVCKLQAGFMANVLGVTTKIAAFSTGVHGLKYGDCGAGQYNALVAQFLPQHVATEDGPTLAVTEVRRGFVATDIAVSPEFSPFLVGTAEGRGT